MTTRQKSLVAVLLASFAGCDGQQLVEFGSPTALPTVTATSPGDAATNVTIDSRLSATFSAAMDAATITAATFIVSQGTTPVGGTVAAQGATATFSPSGNLAANTTYGATIKAGVKDTAGNALAADYNWTFTTSATGATSLTVTSTIPANAATGVAINSKVSAIFSAALDGATTSATTFTVSQGTTPVVGTVVVQGATATFSPAANLAVNTTYAATIKAGVKDTAGNGLVADYNWTFKTSATLDTTPPTVTSTDPLNLATNVPVGQKIKATFSEAMDPATIGATTFTVTKGTPPTAVGGAVTYLALGSVATFAPAVNLTANTKHTATVTIGAKDLAGNAMAANFVWTFTTGGPPQVVSTNPLNGGSNLCIPVKIDATFDKLMDPLTITGNTFKLAGPGNTPVNGAVSYDSRAKTASFAPSSSLPGNTTFTATLTTGIKDAAGNPLAVDKVWTFQTSSSPCIQPINLRGVAAFGIASRAGMSSTGVTVVNGDVALYPNPACTDATGGPAGSARPGGCAVHALPPSASGLTVNGSVYFFGDSFDNGGTANSVTNDLNIAWTEGRNKVPTQPTIPADEMAGKTFIPGVYHNANLGLMAGGVAILDAKNDLNATFVFQVDTDLVDSGTVLLPSRVDLVNGAQAKNVWFVVGRDITIGHGTTWNGNILAGRTATVNDGSTVNGRALAGADSSISTGAITLVGAATPSVTTINVP